MNINLDDNQRSIQIVQITDTHLGKQQGDHLLGLDTDFSLNQVVRRVKQDCRQIDLMLVTGDISNDGSLASYSRFRQLTAGVAEHTFWLPGNHDDFTAMQTVVADGVELARSIQVANWQVIMLNSQLPRAVEGHLSKDEIDFLQDALEQSKGRHALLCMHHQPVPIGCEWLDRQRISDADALFSVVDSFDHVRGMLWGHVHQQFDSQRNGVALMSTPSTCIQFAPNNKGFKLDRLSPGYRWLELHADGRIETAVSRVDDVSFNVDYEARQGY